jgi:hypothetical protein
VRLRILNFNIIFLMFISGIHNLPTKYFWHHIKDDNLVRVMLRNANKWQMPAKQERRVRIEQIHLKGEKDEPQRRRKQYGLGVPKAFLLMHQEEEL